jgi:hypothetical protein
VQARGDDLGGAAGPGDALQLHLVLLEHVQLLVHGEHRLIASRSIDGSRIQRRAEGSE